MDASLFLSPAGRVETEHSRPLFLPLRSRMFPDPLEAFPTLTNLSPPSGISPHAPESFPALTNLSPPSGIFPRPPESFRTLTNLSPPSRIFPHPPESFPTLPNLSPPSRIFPHAPESFPTLPNLSAPFFSASFRPLPPGTVRILLFRSAAAQVAPRSLRMDRCASMPRWFRRATETGTHLGPEKGGTRKGEASINVDRRRKRGRTGDGNGDGDGNGGRRKRGRI
jgi:hypothetical protein